MENRTIPPALSLIVPVYNAQGYLAECLDSLLAQDILRENYEILCINDGSTDASAAILDAYCEKYNNVRAVHKENGGVTTARNLGLETARGEYIWFIDADDRIRENVLGRILEKLHAGGCDRLVMNAYTFTDTLSPGELEQAEQGKLPCNVPWQDAVVWRNVLKLSFLKEHGLCFRYPRLTHGEDGLFMYEVAGEDPKTELLPETTYFYRIHSGSAETGVSLESHRKKLRSYLYLTEILRNYYHSGRKDAATANKLMSYLWFSLYEAARLPAEEARDTLEQLKKLGLYPGTRLPECTLESAYLMGGPGVIGRMLDGICRNLHRPWAYNTLRLLMTLKR